jgi:hypothetical protein
MAFMQQAFRIVRQFVSGKAADVSLQAGRNPRAYAADRRIMRFDLRPALAADSEG